ncbi:Double-stranded RNA-binding protein Staufen -like protein 2 [Toxocara canis]|uniref:Double-stranded RNA-binding protein Staufen-like protein 2 n=1 Tax=Toxocara canis TaxID=6265 RepID=A0A0B2VE63_TOXCA|nr:Double-stranded RNA-binding protein Staufen -like protein 2 [Toxocara canis]
MSSQVVTATNGDYKKKSAAFQPQPWCGQHLTGQEPAPLKNVYNYAQMDERKEKTPMCRIAELARFNKLKHEYKLMDESGPAHKKRFTVSLILTPDQVFDGCGASIKKAQQAAADAALKATTLPRPPERNPQKKLKKDPRNPLILLSYVAHHLGFEPNFSEMGAPVYSVPPSFLPAPASSLRHLPNGGFVPIVSERFLPPPPTPPFAHICPPPVPMILSPTAAIPGYVQPPPYIAQRVYQVRLTLSDDMPEFIGKGPTKQKAKLNAATQALLHLGPSLVTLEAQLRNATTNPRQSGNNKNGVDVPCEKRAVTKTSDEDSSDQSTGSGSENGRSPTPDGTTESTAVNRSGKPKSAISQIHECALQMRMNVEFEILREEGPAHDRHYMMRCKMISPDEVVIADGEGGSKKIAKQNACALMLTKLKSLETSPIFIASSIFKSQKKASIPKEVKRKTIIKDMKMDPGYGHQINPVSRLMQVMQARKENEPKFQLIAEHGQSRYKEFVVEVACADGLRCEGTGPNKKLAKRAAAEAMLARIGYVKPMPKPGKSLLKKRNEVHENGNSEEAPLEIGIFNPDEHLATNAVATVVEESGVDSRAVSDSPVKESVSEVTLSVTASIGSQVMTFADVDQAARADDRRAVWGTTAAESTSFPDADCTHVKREGSSGSSSTQAVTPTTKRRVTFSNEVSACPPPDDSTYPSALITPLKSEVLFVNKVRRRGRDSKKVLSDEQKAQMAGMAREFLAGWNAAENAAFVKAHTEDTPKGRRSFAFLAQNESEQQYFSLVSLGIEKPIVCHGGGITEEAAHDNAAYNALVALSTCDLPSATVDSI